MNYDAIILELMGRIKILEEKAAEYGERLTALEGRGPEMGEPAPSPAGDGGSNRSAFAQRESYTTTTEEMIDACYAQGKAAWESGRCSMNELAPLAVRVSQETGMNPSSANMYLYVVVSMLRGVVYKRAINKTATRRYFQRIFAEYGQDGLKNAIAATREHILYRQGLGHYVPQLISICDEFEGLL